MSVFLHWHRAPMRLAGAIRWIFRNAVAVLRQHSSDEVNFSSAIDHSVMT